MSKIRVYVDTSVIGGVEDEIFSKASKLFFEAVRKGEFQILVSDQTDAELEEAPAAVKAVLDTIPAEAISFCKISEEVLKLAKAYVKAGAVGEASIGDATHVALASVYRADLIVSWNFKHIVNYGRIRKFNGVNSIEGYPTLDIRSPEEVVSDGKEDKKI